jgi:hypothetical protein
MHSNELISLEIQKTIDDFNDSSIVDYYEKYGDKRASQNALSSLRMKHKMPKIKKKQTEDKFPKNLLEQYDKECDTRTELLEITGLSNGAYERLCHLYGLQEKRADKSIRTKLAKQHNVEVWKMVEEEIGLFDSTKKAADYFQIHQTSIGRLTRNRGKKDKGKINFAEASDGSLLTFEFTGKKISDGSKRDPSRQIRVYKLYEIFYKEYDSITDANDDLDISFFKQLQGECYQTGGYRIYKK